MVGPGTGIAPFRAFVEHRAETEAKGKSWLVFGDQHYTYDFLYQLEWQDYLASGGAHAARRGLFTRPAGEGLRSGPDA